MESEGSVPLSQQPANCRPYPETDQSTPRFHIFFLYDTF